MALRLPFRRAGATTLWRRVRRAAAVALAVAPALAAPAAAQALNPIQAENALPGTSAWRINGSASTAIAGYATQMSLQAGQTLAMHVSTTPAARYRVEIYRLGWYQGLGGRLIACLPACGSDEPGTQYAVPASAWLGPGWPVTDSITVGSDWTSGYYVAKLVLTTGPSAAHASYIPFFVLAPPGTSTPILVQASVNTWEAYNSWGGKSLYAFNSSGDVAATQVSFQRPLAPIALSTYGNGPFQWEYQTVRFLERQGYDVSYQTDIDTDENPGSLLGHRLDIVSGHDEYWSHTMRLAWGAAVAHGVNAIFHGGDIGTWQARYGSGDTALYEYRTAAADPNPSAPQKTVQFSQLRPPMPECQLMGAGFSGGLKKPGSSPDSYTVAPAAASNPWFAGTGLAPGDTIFDAVGYEWETVQPGCAVPTPTVLLHYGGGPAPADAVTYTARSGARVFSDGSLQMAWALDDFGHTNPPHADPRVQSLYEHILDDLSSPSELPPTAFRLRSPRPRTTLWNPRPRLRWSRSSDPDGDFGRYLVILDGRVVARTAHTSVVVPRALSEGRHRWSVTAVDGAGNATSTGTWTFTVRSVRIVRHSRRYTLAHGLLVQAFCPGRCTIAVAARLGAGRHGPRLLAHGGHRRGPAIVSVALRLSPRFRAELRHAHRPWLYVTVATRSGRARRRVRLRVRLP